MDTDCSLARYLERASFRRDDWIRGNNDVGAYTDTESGSAVHQDGATNPTDGALQWARLRRPGWWDLLSQVPQLFREGGRTSLRQEGRILRAVVRRWNSAPAMPSAFILTATTYWCC